MWAITMNTSELAPALGPVPSAPDAQTEELGHALAREIELMANRLMSGAGYGGAPATSAGSAVFPSQLSPAAVQPVSPPRVGPSALGVGAGGGASSLSLPPGSGSESRNPRSQSLQLRARAN